MAFKWEPFGRSRGDEPAALERTPRRALAVLTCMDCRIDPLAALGLQLGDAVVLRNAGAHVSDDMLRSLQLAHERLGVRDVHVIGHTDCGAHGGDDAAAAAEVEQGAARIRAVLPDLNVRTGMLDLATGTVR